ncbi:MAG: hypothetical protein ABIS36_25110 [Chryseolinea sp.]
MRFITFPRSFSPNLIIAFSVMVLCSCSRNKAPEGSLDYFRQHLKADMDINDIKESFGETEKLEDPGRTVYKYHLVDSTEVWIGFTEKMAFACFVDENHNLTEDLVAIEQPSSSEVQ